MNKLTAQKIAYIVETAHEDVALTTMKNAKEQLSLRSRVFAGYENSWNGIDRAEVLETIADLHDCRRKAEFSKRCELILETMRNIIREIENAVERAQNPAIEAAELVREVCRIANRDHGVWLTGAEVTAYVSGRNFVPADVARDMANEKKEAQRQADHAAQLAAAQIAYNNAQALSVVALELATATESESDFEAYNTAEEVLTERTGELLRAAGRVALDQATQQGKSIADREALKTMFMPAFTNQIENYHPGRRNELVALALKLDVNSAMAA